MKLEEMERNANKRLGELPKFGQTRDLIKNLGVKTQDLLNQNLDIAYDVGYYSGIKYVISKINSDSKLLERAEPKTSLKERIFGTPKKRRCVRVTEEEMLTVLKHIKEGYRTQAIAKKMNISEKRVYTIRARLRRKELL